MKEAPKKEYQPMPNYVGTRALTDSIDVLSVRYFFNGEGTSDERYAKLDALLRPVAKRLAEMNDPDPQYRGCPRHMYECNGVCVPYPNCGVPEGGSEEKSEPAEKNIRLRALTDSIDVLATRYFFNADNESPEDTYEDLEEVLRPAADGLVVLNQLIDCGPDYYECNGVCVPYPSCGSNT